MTFLLRPPDYAVRYLPEYEACLITITLFAQPERFQQFLKTTFARIRDQNLRRLIIDLRRCRGGTSPDIEVLLAYLVPRPFRLHNEIRTKVSRAVCLRDGLPDEELGSLVSFQPPFMDPAPQSARFDGQVLVLMGPLSLSGSVSFASAIRHFSVGKLVGQESGDTTASYGGPIVISLPNSGLRVAVSSQFVIECAAQEDDGYLSPDYEVSQRRQDTARGVDTVMRFAMEEIGGER